MGIVGNRPETGLRCTLLRTSRPGAGTRATYEGEIVASDGTAARVFASVDQAGVVTVTPAAEGSATEALTKRVGLLLRTIVRECERDGRAQLPPKIVRWWGEK